MPAYIVAIVQVRDVAAFQAYGAAIAGLAEQFGGEYLVRGPVVETLEGEAAIGERVVVSCFPDAAAARAFIASPTYVAAKAHRLGAGDVSMRLIEV
jgi:uncharacterized protein (DUF1330 family)